MLYSGWSHTDPILEAPMRGNHLYHRHIYDLVCLWTFGQMGTNVCKDYDFVNDGENTNSESRKCSNIYYASVYKGYNGNACNVNENSIINGEGNVTLKSRPSSTPQMSMFNEEHPMLRPICPRVLVEIARFCNPF